MDKLTIREYMDLYQRLFMLSIRLREASAKRLRIYLQFALARDDTSDIAIKEKRRVTLDVVEARYKFNEAFEAFIAHPFSQAVGVTKKDVKGALKYYLRIDVKREDGKLHITWK